MTVPLNMFEYKARVCKFVRSPNEVGRVPVMALAPMLIAVRRVSALICAGNVPVKDPCGRPRVTTSLPSHLMPVIVQASFPVIQLAGALLALLA